MERDIYLLCNVVDIEPIPMSVANGSMPYGIKRGSIALNPNLLLHDVIYLPSLDCNLISIAQPLGKIYCMVTFTKKCCVV